MIVVEVDNELWLFPQFLQEFLEDEQDNFFILDLASVNTKVKFIF